MHKISAFIFTYRGALAPLAFLPVVIPIASTQRLYGYIVGASLIILGISIRVLGVRSIGGRARVHSAGARQIITWGIYGHTRNPLYVGNSLVIGGVASLFFSPLSTPFVLLYLLCLYTMIAMYEEKCLLEQFGPSFSQYMKNVPRWLFRLSRYPDSVKDIEFTPWSVVFKRERYFISCNLALIIISFFGFTDGLQRYSIPVAAAIVLITIYLFLRIGLKLHKKRGSWLAFERTIEEGKA